MKYLQTSFLILCLMFLAYQSMAQGNPNRQGQGGWDMRNFKPEEAAERQTKLLKDSLNLSEEQAKKVQAINMKYAQKTQKLLADSTMEQIERFQEMRTQGDNRAYEIRKVLNKEQIKKFNEMQERMRAGRNGRQNNRPNNSERKD